jgi:monoterpene epsilon-lactone hydrolase
VTNKERVAGMATIIGLWIVSGVWAQEDKPYVSIPSTVSDEAKALLRSFTDPRNRPASPKPDEIEKWRAMQEATEAAGIRNIEPLLDVLKPEVTEMTLGGVPTLEVKPQGWKDNGKVLVYTHGGAYTSYSARSTLHLAALTAHATGYRVLSIDYTLAPQAGWKQISDEIIAVFKALLEQGYQMRDIGFFGDSAGGGLASTSTLRLRDEGLGTPAAVVLFSPMVDLTTPGDSYSTLADAEPMYLLDLHIRNALDAYADPADQKNPYVSSVYGDYAKGYPPTLIQAGTKELVLSSPVRLYQAMDTAGVDVKLDIYEGMPHVFQGVPGLPEAELALGKVNAFLKNHLAD